ncbi:MAG: decaprenyl-phosphate phosphoribosyltransferase [Candidatus Sumerlaeaceae bacterium]|nr:decaprenyl-phosphate phosphoribosyltransferase [Candidatus Sumerlaeaceae bacterium]
MKTCALIIEEMRPKQWTKNLLLFAGLVFSHNLTRWERVLEATAAFLVFCGLSGVVYIYNDIRDAASDRQHPLKQKRPIASGRLPVSTAWTAAVTVAAAALGGSLLLNAKFAGLALLYFFMMLTYSAVLKHLVILDLMVVAMGFVIRAVAGVKAIEHAGETIVITPWFITCVLFLALFIAICKRRHELVLLSDGARNHRPVLEHYSTAFVDQMVSVATAATVISYALYVTLGVSRTQVRHPELMIWTLPFVLYGIFRYLYLAYRRDEGGAPEALLLQDIPLLVNVLLWLATVSLIFYL